MSKVSMKTIDNLQNESSAVGAINSNFTALQAIIDNLVSRNGTAPNQMVSLLDMNNQRIINLPAPINDNEPARHGDLQGYVDAAEAAQEAAETAQEAAETAEAGAEAFENEVETLRDDFVSRYLGSLASDPTVDEIGNPVKTGAFYFNTTYNEWRVYVHDEIYVVSDQVVDGSLEVVLDYWQAFPTVTLHSMNDVSADDIEDGQVLIWKEGTAQFEPVDYPASVFSIVEKTDDFTFALTDFDNSYIRVNKATSVNATVPPHVSVDIPIGSVVSGVQSGAGQVTFVAGSGVTINTPATLKLRTSFSSFSLIKVATNTWDLTGDLEAPE